MPLGTPVRQCLVELGLLPLSPFLKKDQWPRHVKELCYYFDCMVDAVVEEDRLLHGTDESSQKLSTGAAAWVDEHASTVLQTNALSKVS